MQQPATPDSSHVLITPLWVFIIRVFQSVLSLIILALSGRVMSDIYYDEEGLALAVAIISWLIVKYAIFTERIPSLRQLYHIIAILVLDGLMVILWLSAWAAVAARRAKFPSNLGNGLNLGGGSGSNCFDGICIKKSKRALTTLNDWQTDANIAAAVAGLGALVWVLFIATFSYTLIGYLKGRKEGRFLLDTEKQNVTNQTILMEPKQEQQVQQQQQLIQPQHTDQQYPPQGQYPQQTQSPYPPAQSPYQQQPPYAPPQGQYPPQEQQAYPQYPPQQQVPQQYQQPQSYTTTPPPAAASPPPHQGPYQEAP